METAAQEIDELSEFVNLMTANLWTAERGGKAFTLTTTGDQLMDELNLTAINMAAELWMDVNS